MIRRMALSATRGSRRGLSLLGVVLGVCLLVGGACSKPQVGDACTIDGDCQAVGPGAQCLGKSAGFPNGYCSVTCTEGSCLEGQMCRPLVDSLPSVCLAGCKGTSECSAGNQCYEGVCQPACAMDSDCRSDGHVCEAGACVARPGKPPGDSCAVDTECQFQACAGSRCVRSCQREAACQTGETCALDRDANRVRGLCIPTRSAAGKTPLTPCLDDAQCKQGACVMGVCLLMCKEGVDCRTPAGDAQQCVELPAPLRKLSPAKWPRMKGCLPANQSLEASYKATDALLVPATGRSVTMVMTAPGVNNQSVVGMQWINGAAGDAIYVVPAPGDNAGYFRQAIRHQPNYGSSTLLLSGAPKRLPLVSSVYPFQAFGQDSLGANLVPEVTAVYKLADVGPDALTTGRLPLRIHIADLSGLPMTCPYRTVKADTAATVLAPMLRKFQELWAQTSVGITFDPVTYVDSSAATSIDAQMPTALGDSLQEASKNSGGGADLVLVRSITPNGILGIAGGIPSAPAIKNNPRTGAVFAVSLLCAMDPRYGLPELGATAAHELGHSFGLSHAVERSGQGDPLGTGMGPSESTMQGKGNLMYWSSEGGGQLTAEQGQVLRSMPQVRK